MGGSRTRGAQAVSADGAVRVHVSSLKPPAFPHIKRGKLP